MFKKVHHVFQVVELGVDKKLFFFFFKSVGKTCCLRSAAYNDPLGCPHRAMNIHYEDDLTQQWP